MFLYLIIICLDKEDVPSSFAAETAQETSNPVVQEGDNECFRQT